MKTFLRKSSVQFLVFLFGFVPFVNAATYVVSNLNDGGPGSLRQAILDANANAGADIISATGITGTINLSSGQLSITDPVSIIGPGADLLNVHNINAFADDVNWRIFDIGNVTVSISGITISGGFVRQAALNGAGINNNGQLTITNCIISGNTASGSALKNYNGSGAGIYNAGTLTIDNSVIDNNLIDNTSPDPAPFSFGAGIANTGTLNVNNSTVSNNVAAGAGGINNTGTAVITGSSIINNTAGLGGGGIYQQGGSLIIVNTTISGNNSGSGAGIEYENGTCKIINCTITANYGGYGAGIANDKFSLHGIVTPGEFTISNSILAGNSGPQDIFGAGSAGDYYFPHDESIPPAGYANLTSLGNNIFGDVNAPLNWTFTGAGDSVGSDASPVNPLLGVLADNGGPTLTHALLAGSPALNAGNNSLATDANNAVLTTDQRGTGFSRIVNDTVDIGAFEDQTQFATFYLDADGDGFGNVANRVRAATAPQGYVSDSSDCNDADGSVWQTGSLYIDADGDGYDNGVADVCYGATAPAGYSLTTNGSDCNDADGGVWQTGSLYIDADGDGYDNGVADVCYGATAPAGYSLTTNGTDCNDNDVSVHTAVMYYIDADHDNYGSSETALLCASTAPVGYSSQTGDCDDNNAAINPGAVEICGDNIDNNCNGQIDEGCTTNSFRITIADKAKREGNRGQSVIRFTVQLNKPATSTIHVNYATQDVTATAGSDYVATSGTVTFNTGVKKQTISVVINGDKTREPDETFKVVLSNPTGAVIADGEAYGTILNDDGAALAGTVQSIAVNTVQLQSKSVTVSPNPATTMVYVQLNGYSGIVTMQLHSLDGKVIKQEKLQVASKSAQQRLDITGVVNGIYLLTVTDEKGNMQTQKIVISR